VEQVQLLLHLQQQTAQTCHLVHYLLQAVAVVAEVTAAQMVVQVVQAAVEHLIVAQLDQVMLEVIRP
jgi:hypothetical protein